jgi:hypothetical protein
MLNVIIPQEFLAEDFATKRRIRILPMTYVTKKYPWLYVTSLFRVDTNKQN